MRFAFVSLLPALALADKASYSFAPDSTALRAALMAGYDKHVPAQSNRSATFNVDYSMAGTDIALQLRFFKVESVRPSHGDMRLKIWMRCYWQDDRLRWDPAAYNGLEYTMFWVDPTPTGSSSEIWVPDIQPYNAIHGTVSTLEPAYAMVSSTGEIFLSRPGTLEVMCKFSGLVAFPFDKLICNVEFGGWGWSGGQQGLELRGPGYQFSAQEATAGSTYQEYKIINISVARENYFYDCCPSEPWPVVTYEIKLDRSSNFYVFTLLVPTCIITCLSFVVFWAPPSAADALSFGITIIVVVILMNVVLLELLPICGELLWIDLFMFVNTLFCMLSLFQSALTILIEQTTSEFIMPTWLVLPAMLLWKKMFPKGLCISAKKRKQIYAEEALFKDDMASSEASIQLAKSLDVKESIAGVMYRQHGPGGRTARVESITRPELTERDMERLCYFEKLFFRMDEDHNGAISMDECTLFLSFVCLDLDVAERKVAFDKADVVKDGGLTRLEFCELCRKELWDMPISTIQIAVDNMLTARQAIKTRLASKWQRVAQRVDVESRLLLPATYLITLVFLFNFDFQDRYASDPRIAMMAPDYMIIALGSSSTAWFILMGLAFFLILGSWCLMQRMGKAAQRKKKELERDYVATLSKKLEKTTRETRAGGDSGYKKDGGFAQPAHVLDGEAAEAARLESESAASGLAVR